MAFSCVKTVNRCFFFSLATHLPAREPDHLAFALNHLQSCWIRRNTIWSKLLPYTLVSWCFQYFCCISWSFVPSCDLKIAWKKAAYTLKHTHTKEIPTGGTGKLPLRYWVSCCSRQWADSQLPLQGSTETEGWNWDRKKWDRFLPLHLNEVLDRGLHKCVGR